MTEYPGKRQHVYGTMLAEYRTAADRLLRREEHLKKTLKESRARGASAASQRELVQRILLLREEYWDLLDAMHRIRGYAESEAAS